MQELHMKFMFKRAPKNKRSPMNYSFGSLVTGIDKLHIIHIFHFLPSFLVLFAIAACDLNFFYFILFIVPRKTTSMKVLKL